MMLINGVSSNSIEVVSYGEENPSVLGTNEETHSLNRRVEIVFSNTGKYYFYSSV
jgi:peptidoglycan-associated lipoprotein